MNQSFTPGSDRSRAATRAGRYDGMAMSELDEIRSELAELRARNARVDREKAWETSWARRLVIATMTWLAAWVSFTGLGSEHAARDALLPSGAYAISTLSLPLLRRLWLHLQFGGK